MEKKTLKRIGLAVGIITGIFVGGPIVSNIANDEEGRTNAKNLREQIFPCFQENKDLLFGDQLTECVKPYLTADIEIVKNAVDKFLGTYDAKMEIVDKEAQIAASSREQITTKEIASLAKNSLITGCPGFTFAEIQSKNCLGFSDGFVLMGNNVQNKEQLKQLISDLKEKGGVKTVYMDHEGGRVLRLNDGSPSAAEMGTQKSAKEWGVSHGKLLKEIGVDVNLAPVADITNLNSAIGDRSFGNNPQLVAQMVSDYVSGLKSQGVEAVLKHWPGHGEIEADTHQGLGVLNKTKEQILNHEWIPFKAGLDAGAKYIMVGHIAVPEIDGQTPASRSKALQDWLKQLAGKKITILSDEASMGGVGLDPISATFEMLEASDGKIKIISLYQNQKELYDTAYQFFANQSGMAEISNKTQSPQTETQTFPPESEQLRAELCPNEKPPFVWQASYKLLVPGAFQQANDLFSMNLISHYGLEKIQSPEISIEGKKLDLETYAADIMNQSGAEFQADTTALCNLNQQSSPFYPPKSFDCADLSKNPLVCEK